VSTEIYKGEILGIEVIKKNSSHNLINESFITLKGLNNLAKQIPNFCYVYGLFDNYLLSEFVKGISLSEWIDKKFNFSDFLNILIQVSLSIHMAQKAFLFVHWDLVPWNIIITPLEKQIEIDYIINERQVYRLKTNFIAKIIDFEKSHIVYENIHYGGVVLFKTSKIQDIITLLMMSINEICKKKMEKRCCQRSYNFSKFYIRNKLL
jgi:serine/threonine protein kinase